MAEMDGYRTRPNDAQIPSRVYDRRLHPALLQDFDGSIHSESFGYAPEVEGERPGETNSATGEQRNVSPVSGLPAFEPGRAQAPLGQRRGHRIIEGAIGFFGQSARAIKHGEQIATESDRAVRGFAVYEGKLAGGVMDA